MHEFKRIDLILISSYKLSLTFLEQKYFSRYAKKLQTKGQYNGPNIEACMLQMPRGSYHGHLKLCFVSKRAFLFQK